ncbi:MAG TPA: AIPR family protein [Acidimicrobiales bacterium]|nr:AIPR family protein [Acidimicrobiales bacterium]
MSTLHLRHIESALDAKFATFVDLTDVSSSSPQSQRQRFLARSLAAYPVSEITASAPQEVALGITDGTDDNGIDLVYYDSSQERLYFVQSKWHADGSGGPQVGEIQKFIQGFRDLVNLRFDRFNEKVRHLQRQITAALDNPRVTIECFYLHTGTHDPTDHVKRLFDDLENEMNDSGEVLHTRVFKQSDLHAMVSGEVEGDRIDLDIALFDWGQVTEPFAAYYGQVAASDVAAWWRDHGSNLFSRNLRKFIQASEVNNTIAESLKSSPDHFWYLNNGITVLCQSIARKAIGGLDRKHGQFACEGVSVVNGAQTVGSIGTGHAGSNGDGSAADARVLVRLISLENCPPSFANTVTRATNTQNRIVNRDFVALDPEQERLRIELRIDGLTYALKTGDADPAPDDGCSVVDATVALGCAVQDVQWAVQVKREIGKIWEDTESSLYRSIFNAGVSSTGLWRSVQVMRVTDARLATIQRREEGRRRQAAVHGNRLLLHCVYRCLPVEYFREGSDPITDEVVQGLVDKLFEAMVDSVEADYEANYLASLFKNLTKCRTVRQGMLTSVPPVGLPI